MVHEGTRPFGDMIRMPSTGIMVKAVTK